MMLALVTVLLAGFASCSKSDDDNNTSKQNTTATSGLMSFDFVPTEDDLIVYDITAEYTDASGKQQTETITGEWKKSVTFTTLPAKASLVIKMALKANVVLSKDEYKVGYKITPKFQALNAEGGILDFAGYTPSEEYSYYKDKGKEGLEEYAKLTVISYSYTISSTPNAKGKYIY